MSKASAKRKTSDKGRLRAIRQLIGEQKFRQLRKLIEESKERNRNQREIIAAVIGKYARRSDLERMVRVCI